MNRITSHPAFPFVSPFAVFLAFLSIEGWHEAAIYLVYPIKTLAVFMLLLYLWRRFPTICFPNAWQSVGIGVVVFVLWVGAGPFLALGELKAVFKPFLFEDQNVAWGLVIVRIFGASLVVPVMEELFWRGFLMRYLIQDRFEEIELGTYRPFSFWATTCCFAAVHGPFAPVAFITGIVYGFWFVKTRSLGNVMLAHGVTNLLLGIYVVHTGKWFFW
ncbi:MAG: CAAX prenyl protease-related protein [Methylacidiphilales bacterium]|nr:CAAX prenyl protease-related protein [Candidatus Methylacidiphilales bacterium]